MNLLILLLILLTSAYSHELRRINLHNRALNHNDSQNSRILDGSYPNSYPLLKNVLVQADFGQAHFALNTELDGDPINDILLGIMISSNETGLPTSYESGVIKTFVCDSSYCIEENSTLEFEFPWTKTTAKRMHINTTISIGSSWELKTSALSFGQSYGNRITHANGWIGLGTESGAKKNFRDQNPTFSLLINETAGGTGSLIFGFDSRIADIDRPLMVVRSDANWKMQMTSLSFGSVVYVEDNKTLQLIFDLTRHGVSLPRLILNKLLDLICTYNVTCYGSGFHAYDLIGLPSLVFSLTDGKNLSIKPENYMKTNEEDLFDSGYLSLNFKNIENHEHIILGWDVLARFYTLFQQIDGTSTISFYEINTATSNPKDISANSSNWTLRLALIRIVLIVILICVGVIIFINRKNKYKIEINTTELSKLEDSESYADPQEQNQFL